MILDGAWELGSPWYLNVCILYGMVWYSVVLYCKLLLYPHVLR